MENNNIIRQCDLIRENNYYKWYDVKHIKGLETCLALIFSKETRIAHLLLSNGEAYPVKVNDNGVLDLHYNKQ